MAMEGNGVGPHGRSSPGRERIYQLVEVSVFLFLFVPSMIPSFLMGKMGNLNFPGLAILLIVRDLSMASLVLFFIWRNGEPLMRLGLTLKNAWPDCLWGLALFIPITYGAEGLEIALRSAGLSGPTSAPYFLAVRGVGEIGLALILVAVAAVTEETIFRGYLLLRFQALNLSPLGGAILSSGIFALGHGYEGSAGVVTVAALGLILALVYLWRGSLVAPMVIHFLQDFSGLVLPALVGMK